MSWGIWWSRRRCIRSSTEVCPDISLSAERQASIAHQPRKVKLVYAIRLANHTDVTGSCHDPESLGREAP